MGTPELKVEGHVARITLRRPEQANRLEPEDLEVLAEHIASINATPEVLVLVLQSQGKYFCSGYNIGAIGNARAVAFDEVIDALEDCRPVTVALLHGSVYGGATDMALACDFRMGAKGIDMFMPAARLGLHFYPRGLERYVTRVGLDNAKRLFLTAESIDADEMKRISFLTHLEPAENLNEAAERLIATLSAMAPIPVVGMKKHLNRIARGTLDAVDLAHDIARSHASADLREGQAAWIEKRVPRFTGK